MKRPWQVWLTLAVCGAVVASAMGWLTVHALRADRERTQARAAADLEQRVSLALWRMDTKLAPLIAEESARPHFYYSPFITVEAPRSKEGPDREQVASPLLTGANTSVLLNFTCPPSGDWTSPQAPPAEFTSLACDNGMTLDEIASNRSRLSELAAEVNYWDLLAQLPEQPIRQTDRFGTESEGLIRQEASQAADTKSQSFYSNYGVIAGAADGLVEAEQAANTPADAAQLSEQVQSPAQDSRSRNYAADFNDLGSRAMRYQEQVGQEYVKQQRDNAYRQVLDGTAATPAVENITRPLWVGERLLLARRVVEDGTTVIQGSWLNWPRIKSDLLAETADLVPGADLVAVRDGVDSDPTRMLAGLPVRLVASETPLAVAAQASPLRWALGAGWASIVLALIALAALLWGVMALSERRAAFVSSVTHELRTPLTTFRMYSEMLVRDMAPSPERRREYLETLRTEAERLTHLVDNVLAYARLERGRRPRRSEQTTATALVERFEPRLAERASQSSMTLACRVAPDAADVPLLTDVGVVEQILFNLVDNAAKYAARAEDRRIHLDVEQAIGSIGFTVSDHGPGFLSLRVAARSAPFSKSAEDAAESAPGVGLGLALCRRLARELGGRLDVAAAPDWKPGAAVTLTLPSGD
jgi:signal transduction histidine kinase